MTMTERDERLALGAMFGYRRLVYHDGRADVVRVWDTLTEDEREVWVWIARAVDTEIAREIAGDDPLDDFTGRGL